MPRYLLLALALACSTTPPRTSEQAGAEATAEPTNEATTPTDPFVAELLSAHGMTNLGSARVRFTFRGDRFDVERQNGSYRYARTREADGRRIVDTLRNDGFSRNVGGEEVSLDARSAHGLSEGVNSVVYFAFLPFPLADDAVRSVREDSVEIDGRSMSRLRVTFDEEGGGSDHDDEFYYWFDGTTQELVFMAYRYARGGGGVRFRVAKNARRVGDVLFFDYDNYAYSDLQVDLADLPSRRAPSEGPRLELLSVIELENIEVLP